jgi:hypothetical protein|tara:strand:- start:487 stop:939 length:453 start_codon:yes stop_codon:yes gene_type:complete
MNISNTVTIINNFLSNTEIKNSMNAFKLSKDVRKFKDRFIVPSDEVKDYKKIVKKLEDCFYLKVDWWQVIKCPIGSTMDKHIDTSEKETIASFIIFLNDNFQGGHLIFSDGISVHPKKGRIVFFDGPNLIHEVNKNIDGERYILAGWFCK